MKTINRKIVTLALTLLIANIFAQPTPPGFAIAVQGTNIVLNWRSSTNEIYLIEHRPTLASTTQWGELTNYFPSAANTNWTKFVHTNIVRAQPMDFYRFFDVTPVARNDFFAVDQNSFNNQLDILQNDYSPNDDLLYISNLIPAPHGSISYTPDICLAIGWAVIR